MAAILTIKAMNLNKLFADSVLTYTGGTHASSTV